MVALDMSADERVFMESARRAVKSAPWLMETETSSNEEIVKDYQPFAFGVIGLALGAVAAALSAIAFSSEAPFAAGSTSHVAILVLLLGYYLGIGLAALRAMVRLGKSPNLLWFVTGSFVAVALKEALPFLS